MKCHLNVVIKQICWNLLCLHTNNRTMKNFITGIIRLMNISIIQSIRTNFRAANIYYDWFRFSWHLNTIESIMYCIILCFCCNAVGSQNDKKLQENYKATRINWIGRQGDVESGKKMNNWKMEATFFFWQMFTRNVCCWLQLKNVSKIAETLSCCLLTTIVFFVLLKVIL